MKTETIQAFHFLSYDVPAEQRIPEIREKKEEELTPREKKILKENQIKVRLRQEVAWGANRLGTYINKSAYIVPPENLNKVKNMVGHFREEYKKLLNIDPDIFIVQFSGNATQSLREKALRSLEERLNGLLDQMDKLEEKLSEGDREIRQSEKKKIIENLETIEDLSKQFNIKKKLENLLIICEEKIKGL